MKVFLNSLSILGKSYLLELYLSGPGVESILVKLFSDFEKLPLFVNKSCNFFS